MLSILIPTYNRNITKLVKDLHWQAIRSYIDFEIIVLEDNSKKYVAENKTIVQLEHCKYISLNKNLGRSAARNRLAREAKCEHMLFMDCDAEIISSHFIEKYESFCREDSIVIGGTAYDPDNQDPNYSLRLKYGREREARSANERRKNNFSTFNFLISKSIFNQVGFDESIQGYGHEDMIFGHQLRLLNHEFLQIDNALLHAGLDDNLTFVRKTEEATRNLWLLYQSGRYPFLATDSKLIKHFIKLKKYKLVSLCALFFDKLQLKLQDQLCSESPSLFLFDLYKLLFICKTSISK